MISKFRTMGVWDWTDTNKPKKGQIDHFLDSLQSPGCDGHNGAFRFAIARLQLWINQKEFLISKRRDWKIILPQDVTRSPCWLMIGDISTAWHIISAQNVLQSSDSDNALPELYLFSRQKNEQKEKKKKRKLKEESGEDSLKKKQKRKRKKGAMIQERKRGLMVETWLRGGN